MRIDAYTHFLPKRFFDKLQEISDRRHRKAHALDPGAV